MKKNAFTLAEVLITLGIIGIVAAILLPQVITNYEKRDTETRLQKAYATISNAFKMAEAEYGPIEYWYTTGQTAETVFNHFKPYMKFAVEPKVPGSMQIGNSTSSKNYSGVYFKLPDGTCGIFRNNGWKSSWGDSAYFWHIYTKCERKMIAGRTSFEFSVMNSRNLSLWCTNGITNCWKSAYGFNGKNGNGCGKGKNDYGWKEYECFFWAATNNWEFPEQYEYGVRTNKEANITEEHYKKMPGWH